MHYLPKKETSKSKEKNRTIATNSGFTLVELMVFATIASLLFGLGYANYRNYAQRQAFLSFVRQIDGDLQMAKNLASSGTKPSPECDDPLVLDGYRFVWNGVDYEYSIVPVCSGSNKTAKLVRSVDPDVYEFSVNHNNFKFKTIGQGFEACSTGCDPNEARISVKNLSLNKTVSIDISSSGEVKVQEQ